MSNTTNTTTHFTVDFLNKKITGTKASFDKARKGISPFYKELTEKIKTHPSFALEKKEPKKHSNKAKRSYHGMDFKFMEAYIEIQTNAESIMKNYEEVRKMAKDTGTSVYPFTKKWFLQMFSTEEKPFDMVEAKEAITEYRIALAEQRAQAEAPTIAIAEPEVA